MHTERAVISSRLVTATSYSLDLFQHISQNQIKYILKKQKLRPTVPKSRTFNASMISFLRGQLTTYQQWKVEICPLLALSSGETKKLNSIKGNVVYLAGNWLLLYNRLTNHSFVIWVPASCSTLPCFPPHFFGFYSRHNSTINWQIAGVFHVVSIILSMSAEHLQ